VSGEMWQVRLLWEMDRHEAELERAAANAHEIALRLAGSNQARRIATNFARLRGLLRRGD